MTIWLLIYQALSSYCDKFQCFTTSKLCTPNQIQLYESTIAYTFWFKYYLQSNGPFRITIFREQTDLAITRGFSYDIVINDSIASHEINLMNYQTFWENQLQVPVEQDQGEWHFVVFSIENYYINLKIAFNQQIYRALVMHIQWMPLLIENNIYHPKTIVLICQEQWLKVEVIDTQFFEEIVNCRDKRDQISIKYRIDILNYKSTYFDINYQKFHGWFRDLNDQAKFSLDFHTSTYDKQIFNKNQVKIFIIRFHKLSNKFNFQTYDWSSDLFEEYLLQVDESGNLKHWYSIQIDFPAKQLSLVTSTQQFITDFQFFKKYPNAQIELQINGVVFYDLYIQDETAETCSPDCEVCLLKQCKRCRGNRIGANCECPRGMTDYGEHDCEYSFRKLDIKITNKFDDNCEIGYQQCGDQIVCDHNYIGYESKCYKCPQLGEEICQACQRTPSLLQNKLTCQYLSTINLKRFKNNDINEFMNFQNEIELLSMETIFYDRELSSIIIEYKVIDQLEPLVYIRKTMLFQKFECPENHKAFQNIYAKVQPICQKLPKGCLDIFFYEYKVLCKLCKPSYSLINNICIKCPRFCQSCTIEKCISCVESYFVTLQGECQLCRIPNCRVCYQYFDGLFSLNNAIYQDQYNIVYCGLCDEGLEFNYQSLLCQVQSISDCSLSIYDQKSICYIDAGSDLLSTQCNTENCKQCYLNQCIICQIGYYLDNEHCQICQFTQSGEYYVENKNFILNCQPYDPVHYSQFKYQLQHLYLLHQNIILKPIHTPLKIIGCFDNLVLYDLIFCQQQNNLMLFQNQSEYLCQIRIQDQQQKQFCIQMNSQYQGIVIDRTTGQVKYCDKFKACELTVNYHLIQNQTNKINYNNFTSMSLNQFLQAINYENLVQNQISFINIYLLFSALNEIHLSYKGPIRINLYIQFDLREERMQNLNHINMTHFHLIHFDQVYFNFFNINCDILEVEHYQANKEQYIIDSYQKYFQRIEAQQILLQNVTISSIKIRSSTIFVFVQAKQVQINTLLIHNISCYNAELLQFENYIQNSSVKFSSIHILNSNFTNCTLFNLINSELPINLEYLVIQNVQFIKSNFIQSLFLEATNILINDSSFVNSTFIINNKYFLGNNVVIFKSSFDQSIVFSSHTHSQLTLQRLKATELMISSSMLIHFTGVLCQIEFTYLFKIIANSSLYVTSFLVIQGNTSIINSFTSLSFLGNLSILTISSQHISISHITILDYLTTYTVGQISNSCALELSRKTFLHHIYLTDFLDLNLSNGFFSNIQSIYPIIKILSQTNQRILLDNITFINIQLFSTSLIEVSVQSLTIRKCYLGQIWFQDIILMESLQYSIIFLFTVDLNLSELEMIQVKNINKGHLRWVAIQTQDAYLSDITCSEYRVIIKQFISEFQLPDYDIDDYSGNKQLIYIDAQNISIDNLQIYNITSTDDYLLYFTSSKQIKSIYLNQIRFITPSDRIFRQHGLCYVNQVSARARFTNIRLIRAYYQKYIFEIRIQDELSIENLYVTWVSAGIVKSEIMDQQGILIIKNVSIGNPYHIFNTYKFEVRIMINVVYGYHIIINRHLKIFDFLLKSLTGDLIRAEKMQSVSIDNMVVSKIQSITSVISIQSDNLGQLQITNLKIIESNIFIPNYRQRLGLVPSNILPDICIKNDVQYNIVTYSQDPYVLIQFNFKDYSNVNINNITLQYNNNISALIKFDQLNSVQISQFYASQNNCSKQCIQFGAKKNFQQRQLAERQTRILFINSLFLLNQGILFGDQSKIELSQTQIDHQYDLYEIANDVETSLILIDSAVLYRSQYILRISNLTIVDSFIMNQQIDHLEKFTITQLLLSFDNGITFYPNVNNTVLFYDRAKKLVNYCNFPTGQTLGHYERLSLKELKYYQFIRHMIIGIKGKFVSKNICNLKYLDESYNFDFKNQNWSQFMIVQKPGVELINMNITCDSVTLLFNIQILDCQLGEIYLNQQCLRCDATRNEYSVSRHSVQCLPKTDQMIAVQSGLIQLKRGYWRPNYNSGEIIKCQNQDNCLGGWNVGDQSCRMGYLGASCQVCDLYSIRGAERYVSNNQECILCTETSIFAYIYALFVIIIQVGLLYQNDKAWDLICQNTRNNFLMNIHHRIIQKYQINQIQLIVYIITHYLQILILINKSTQPILQFISSVFVLYSNPNLTLYQNAECYLSNHLSELELILSKSFLFMVFNIMLFNLFSFVQYLLIHNQIKKYQKKLIFVGIYYLITFSFSNYFEMYNYNCKSRLIDLCTYQNIAGVNWLSANLGIRFDQINHYYQLISLIIPQIGILFFVFPIIVIVRLKSNKERLFNKQVFNNWGYLYQYFKQENYYQGIITIWYRVLIIFITSISQPDAQTTYNVFLLLMAFVYFQLDHNTPYSLSLYNRLNLTIHATTMIIVLILNLMTRFEQKSNLGLSIACQVLICICILVIIYSVFTNCIYVIKKQSISELQSIVLLNKIIFINRIITDSVLKQNNIKEKFNKLKMSIINSSLRNPNKQRTLKQLIEGGVIQTQLTQIRQIPVRLQGILYLISQSLKLNQEKPQNELHIYYKMFDQYLDKAYEGELLNENAIKLICLHLKEIFSNEPNVKRISKPVTIVGDVHGQLYDVQELFKVGGRPPFTNYLFLGDYVDRGAHSVEVMTLLSLLKVKFPNRVTLIRGNHETRGITQNYGFYMECTKKFGNTLAWEYFTDMFDYLPIACLVGDDLFCVHGGLSPCIESIDEIEQIERFQEIPHMGPFTDIMWSDPDNQNPGFVISNRGAGYLYGEQVVKEFLHFNGLQNLIRAHQLCQEGFKQDFNDQCITVWSAPNYLYREQNKASILEVDEKGNKFFNVFSESPENLKRNLGSDAMMLGADKNYFI